MQLEPRSARDVALRILGERYGSVAEDAAPGLLSFQREAVERAHCILDRYGGVLIADSVGLGKTHIALELIRTALAAQQHVVVIGPAALQRHWRNATRDVGAITWLSYARLSRGEVPKQSQLVVFDEAHALRNPATRRYRAATTLCAGARVVLLSATPVNNAISDLYHMLRLFAGDRHFNDVGVPSLRAAFEEARTATLLGDAASLQPVLRAVMIRRTRPFVRDLLAADARSIGLAFPEQQAPRPVYYAFGDRTPGVLDRIGADLLELKFPTHRSPAAPGTEPPAELMRRGLLKRLESSPHAFACSLASYAAMLDRCAAAVDKGYVVFARDESPHDDDEQLRLDQLLFEPAANPREAIRYRAAVAEERAIVARLIDTLPHIGAAKSATLIDLLVGELRDRKVLVFTQYRDTARHLYELLRARHRCALIDGTGAMLGAQSCDRLTVVRCFAPRANGAPVPPAHRTIDVLIATDVLSEGFNLQDASVVISYDLPWNPIRLVQRVGRVDRLGSPHPSVASYYFLPGDLERYLGLVERIAQKTSAIDATVGSDVPVLHGDIVRALDRRDASLIDRIERKDADWFELDERMRALLRQHGPPPPQMHGTWLASLPATGAFCSQASRPAGLVAARVGARLEWIAVVDGRAVDDERACARSLERALSHPTTDAAPRLEDVDRLLALARPALVRRTATRASTALLPGGGPAARVGRRLLGLVAALPGGPDPSTCARVDAALARLARAPDSGIAALPNPSGLAHPALVELLTAIEHLPTSPAAKSLDGTREQRVRIVAVLVERAPNR